MKRIHTILLLISSSLVFASCDQLAIDDGANAAANLLRDPSSAQFRNVRTDGDGYVCGEINGKNGFGAYSGFSEFYAFESVDGDWIATIYDPDQLDGLPPQLVRITKDNHEIAMARCDGDEAREQAIREQQAKDLCDEGNQSMCEIAEIDARLRAAKESLEETQ